MQPNFTGFLFKTQKKQSFSNFILICSVVKEHQSTFVKIHQVNSVEYYITKCTIILQNKITKNVDFSFMFFFCLKA